MEQIGNPSIWAEQGGMMGLVILALFVVLIIFTRAQAKIYEMHRGDLKQLLDLHAKERESWGCIVDSRQKETNEAIHSMSEALSRISIAIKREP